MVAFGDTQFQVAPKAINGDDPLASAGKAMGRCSTCVMPRLAEQVRQGREVRVRDRTPAFVSSRSGARSYPGV
jgi:hypothetical protein